MIDEMLENIDTSPPRVLDATSLVETLHQLIHLIVSDKIRLQTGISLLHVVNLNQTADSIETTLRAIKKLEEDGFVYCTIDKYHYQCIALDSLTQKQIKIK
jgi:hypothetical protein